MFLGFNAIKNLALSIAAIGMLPESPMAEFDGQRYQLHSLTCASLARQLAHRLPQSDPQDYFIAGLLHDFGKVVVAQFMPMEFRRAMESNLWKIVSLHLAMQDVLGVDHAAIGAMLVQELAPTEAQRLGGKLQDIMDSLGDITPLIKEARVFSRL